MVNDIETLGFYPNILAKGVLTAGIRFNRLQRVVLQLKHGWFGSTLGWRSLVFHEFLHLESLGIPRFSLLGLWHLSFPTRCHHGR